jgi:hypothetical protein
MSKLITLISTLVGLTHCYFDFNFHHDYLPTYTLDMGIKYTSTKGQITLTNANNFTECQSGISGELNDLCFTIHYEASGVVNKTGTISVKVNIYHNYRAAIVATSSEAVRYRHLLILPILILTTMN